MAADPKPALYFWGTVTRPSYHDPTAKIEGRLFFCSNFAVSPIALDGKTWPTVEHYYQAQKFPDGHEIRERIRTARTAREAKAVSYGRGTKELVRPDWDGRRLDTMRRALRAKFRQNSALRAKLLATGDAVLHEDAPRDQYWGVCGQDHLGKLLVEVREELRTAADAAAQ